MSGDRESLFADLVDRGLQQRDANESYHRDLLASGIAEGKRTLRRSFVFRFYHHTMTDTNLSGAYHKFGPDSPDPLMDPINEPGWMGGQYRYVPWEFEYDGLRWRAVWEFGHEGSASPQFFIWTKMDPDAYEDRRAKRWLRRVRASLGGKEWREVNSPLWVAELLT